MRRWEFFRTAGEKMNITNKNIDGGKTFDWGKTVELQRIDT